MSNSSSPAGRLFPETPPAAPDFTARSGGRRLAGPAPTLRAAQRACYEALVLALQEGHVFAAVTGPEGSGKTTVLDAVLADHTNRALRVIRIGEPDKMPARLAQQIEQVAVAEAGKPENLDRHIVLAVDDAHLASDELLRCVNRLATMREPGRRVPQVILVGRPELWNRLTYDEFLPLARRLAIRAVLPPLEEDEDDPWAELERDVQETMLHPRDGGRRDGPAQPPDLSPPSAALFDHLYSQSAAGGMPRRVDPAGVPLDLDSVPPPTDFALFPDHNAAAAQAKRASRTRLWLPISCLMVTVAAVAGVLTFYDWPDLLGDMPWSSTEPARPFVFDATQGRSHGIPRPPSWYGPSAPESAPPTQTAAVQPPAAPPPASPPSPSPAAPPAPAPVAATRPAPSAPAPPRPAPTRPEATRPETTRPETTVAALTPPLPSAPPAPSPAPPRPEPAPAPPTARVEPAAPPAREEPASSRPAPEAPAARQETAPAAPTMAERRAAEAPRPTPEPPRAESRAELPRAEPPRVVASAPQTPIVIPAPPEHRVVTPAPLAPNVIELLLHRGDELFRFGDISGARLLFERAAEAGNAGAMTRLAHTYDTAFLTPRDAATLADKDRARAWYTRAVAAGDRTAAARLASIEREP